MDAWRATLAAALAGVASLWVPGASAQARDIELEGRQAVDATVQGNRVAKESGKPPQASCDEKPAQPLPHVHPSPTCTPNFADSAESLSGFGRVLQTASDVGGSSGTCPSGVCTGGKEAGQCSNLECLSYKAYQKCTRGGCTSESVKECDLEPPKPSDVMKNTGDLYTWIKKVTDLSAQHSADTRQSNIKITAAMVLSSLFRETNFNPLSERDDGGRGLGQYTPKLENGKSDSSDKKSGLAYNAKKPTCKNRNFTDCTFVCGDNQTHRGSLWDDSACINQPLNETSDPKLYSVWSPKGQVLSKVRHLQSILKARIHETSDQCNDGYGKDSDLSLIWKSNEADLVRYLMGTYNRGGRVANSLQAYVRTYHQGPDKCATPMRVDYGWVWSQQVGFNSCDLKAGMRLFNECINRCAVEAIAGLCGSAAPENSYFGRFTQWCQQRDGSSKVKGEY